VKHDNVYTLETSRGEALSIVGCCEDDCDCTMIEITKERRGRIKRSAITLPREALEMIRDGIEAVLEFHDLKELD
jgi:hypothetical protein